MLTLLVEGHASYRGIQACLKELLGVEVSLGTIVSIVKTAWNRAQASLALQRPAAACVLWHWMSSQTRPNPKALEERTETLNHPCAKETRKTHGRRTAFGIACSATDFACNDHER